MEVKPRPCLDPQIKHLQKIEHFYLGALSKVSLSLPRFLPFQKNRRKYNENISRMFYKKYRYKIICNHNLES